MKYKRLFFSCSLILSCFVDATCAQWIIGSTAPVASHISLVGVDIGFALQIWAFEINVQIVPLCLFFRWLTNLTMLCVIHFSWFRDPVERTRGMGELGQVWQWLEMGEGCEFAPLKPVEKVIWVIRSGLCLPQQEALFFVIHDVLLSSLMSDLWQNLFNF